MNRTIVLPSFAPDQAAEQVDTALRQALAACDSARECAVLWFAEVQRRALYRELGHASLELYATQALGFSLNRYWQFKRLADDLDRLPVLREAVATGTVGWTKAQQVARVATPQTQVEWVDKAATTGRRELAREVQAARTAARRSVDPGQLEMPPARTPEVAPPVTTISLRADALQLARFEALLEKARKLRVVGPGVDRVDLVLAGLEALLSAEPTGDEASEQAQPRHGHPAVQIVVHQCPDCATATVVTGRGEQPTCAGASGGAGVRRARAGAGASQPRHDSAFGAGGGAGARSAPLRHAGLSVDDVPGSASRGVASGWGVEPGG
ncbi:MAG: hypothetical protein IPH86_17830 [bacterium]|nr:hypothetical protein [bacterium]